MTAATIETTEPIRARRGGFFRDVMAVAERGLRSIPRDLEGVLPPLVFPVFFFIVNIGALQDVAEGIEGIDYKAFQLPVAIIFAVTGVSRAVTLVLDIQSGYFDRLSMTPVNRFALLIGLFAADLALVVALTVPVLALGFALGVGFGTGPLGFLVFIGYAGLWGLVYAGIPYAIALKTGNPAVVNSSFLIFLPLAFLTTVFLPLEAMTGWMGTIAQYNPVTYMLEALRSLLSDGWDGRALLNGLIAILGVGAVSMPLAFLALQGRVRKS